MSESDTKPEFKIHWQASFDMKIREGTVMLLRELGRSHYDSRCKAAASKGFMVGWERLSDSGFPIGTTFHELDIALKICEAADHMLIGRPHDALLIQQFQEATYAILREANLRYLQIHEEG